MSITDLDEKKIRDMIYIPIIAKIVTLTELKTSYTLHDFMDLLDVASEKYTGLEDI